MRAAAPRPCGCYGPTCIVSRNQSNDLRIYDIISFSFLYIINRMPCPLYGAERPPHGAHARRVQAVHHGYGVGADTRTQPPSAFQLPLHSNLSAVLGQSGLSLHCSWPPRQHHTVLRRSAHKPRPFSVQMPRHLKLPLIIFPRLFIASSRSCASHSPAASPRLRIFLRFSSKCSFVDGVVSDPPRQALHVVSGAEAFYVPFCCMHAKGGWVLPLWNEVRAQTET